MGKGGLFDYRVRYWFDAMDCESRWPARATRWVIAMCIEHGNEWERRKAAEPFPGFVAEVLG